MRDLLIVACLGAGLALGCEVADEPQPVAYSCEEGEGPELYERRIAPLLADDRTSSCNQCHLSGVDLSIFAQATPCQTMACMVDKGLVDLDAPEQSLVLTWIDRATPSGGITADTIAAERDGMLAWIEQASQCGTDECPTFDDPCNAGAEAIECDVPPAYGEETRDVDDPGDCADLTIELLWREKVYGWRGRCYPCHFDSHDEDFEEPPPWITTGDCNLASLETLRTAERSGYLDAANPTASLLLTKPLEEALGGVEHGGGPKIHDTAEAAYQDMLYFVERWAACNG